jgi:general secretion pathway protein C
MASPYRNASWVVVGNEEFSRRPHCLLCEARADREALAARARRRLGAFALLVAALSGAALAYECALTTAAIRRAADATREAAVALFERSANAADPPRTPVAQPTPMPPLTAPAPSLAPLPRCRNATASCRAAQLAALGSGIVRRGETSFLLDRRIVDAMLEDQAELMGPARVAPTQVNGQPFPRLSGVEPHSLLAMLGFRNGDCIEWINGFDLSTPEQALEAYARLRTADILDVRVLRNGADVTLEYEFW